MKRRRELEPKREKNRSALIKYLCWALAAVVVGGLLTYFSYRLFGSTMGETAVVESGSDEQPQISMLSQIPAMLLAATIMTVLALVFFGVRAYQTGTKARFSLQQNRRMKIKRK
ncbi:MAG: hypothetical protein GY869_23125 [Planctomycetes bacterium]|nr:hypothetical protein [Planctomycetota bacterium]